MTLATAQVAFAGAETAPLAAEVLVGFGHAAAAGRCLPGFDGTHAAGAEQLAAGSSGTGTAQPWWRLVGD